MDFLPTLASLAKVRVPSSHTHGLRGVDLSPILLLQQRVDEKALSEAHSGEFSRPPMFWRGGGGSPPCWNRSPPVAMRAGDWKLLFAPGHLGTTPEEKSRVELYNVSAAALGEQGGSFLESTNEAKYQPMVVKSMMAAAMAWHENTPCPFGHHNNSRKGSCTWGEIAYPGCESYPFPGKPPKSCRGKPCPEPCVCPPQDHGDVDQAYETYIALRAE
eukprot:COSAG06_NODE_3492_length_5270_cov_2.545736_7_plen_216_part_00